MSIPREGYPLSAAVSPRVHVVETIDSTNAKLMRDAQDDPDSHPHLALLLTRDQRAGRGRLRRTWVTPPGSALAVSVLLRVGAVATHDRGWIPLIAGAAMTDALGAQLPGHEVALKWPNDVLVDGRKICGILAEVLPDDPQTVVLGAGVNTTMAASDLPVPTATSFAALHTVADEDRLVADFVTGLRDRIAELAVGGAAAVADAIAQRCTTIGAAVRVSLPDESFLEGTAVRLDMDGRLVVRAPDGEETVVGAGDVVHVR
ncbi:biotin--[acetyl-CoA-carboxylase] ligase [Microbacterium sp. VKM Ac-2870]|uniref:biotin--[acetyl-CoA-carboxylase] ligase n=1 Tax=Microbacterium sp. VKM Ac-2870 TaxID=2783825 RepID=UPI001889E9CD|nr:biotin--[acetyl-CoA-carboxylase] ligase [Microbacterium sp. VKM Ac-2870]MBF4561655.1 biotin--[acetyl-CoA-carboxylase] ligase [Microbacterium sp. VKM Ac-2870]